MPRVPTTVTTVAPPSPIVRPTESGQYACGGVLHRPLSGPTKPPWTVMILLALWLAWQPEQPGTPGSPSQARGRLCHCLGAWPGVLVACVALAVTQAGSWRHGHGGTS
jgi:hypothetical protein